MLSIAPGFDFFAIAGGVVNKGPGVFLSIISGHDKRFVTQSQRPVRVLEDRHCCGQKKAFSLSCRV